MSKRIFCVVPYDMKYFSYIQNTPIKQYTVLDRLTGEIVIFSICEKSDHKYRMKFFNKDETFIIGQSSPPINGISVYNQCRVATSNQIDNMAKNKYPEFFI